MFSKVTFLVQHGEDTDRLNYLISHVTAEYDSAHGKSYPGRPIILDYSVEVDVKEIPVSVLEQGMTMIGKNGAEATVHRVYPTASGIYVTMDTEFGAFERRYAPDETVTVK